MFLMWTRACSRIVRLSFLAAASLLMSAGASASDEIRAIGYDYSHSGFEYIWLSPEVSAKFVEEQGHGHGSSRYYALEGEGAAWRRLLAVRVFPRSRIPVSPGKFFDQLADARRDACKGTKVKRLAEDNHSVLGELVSQGCDRDKELDLWLLRVVYGERNAFALIYMDRGDTIRQDEVERWRRILSEVSIRTGRSALAAAPTPNLSVPEPGGALDVAGFGRDKKRFEYVHFDVEKRFRLLNEANDGTRYAMLYVLDWDSTGWKRGLEVLNWRKKDVLPAPRQTFEQMMELRKATCNSNEVRLLSEDDSSVFWEIASTRCAPAAPPAGHSLHRLLYGKDDVFMVMYTDLGSADPGPGLELWRRFLAGAKIEINQGKK